jgi:hypothetical protein
MKNLQADKKRTAVDKRGDKGDRVEKDGKPASPDRPTASSKPPRVAFPKKNQPPAAAAFAARLPLALGKRFEMARSFLLRQEEVKEEVHFYGPKTGWALRYLKGARPICSLVLHGDLPVGIVSLDAAASATVDWKALSPVGQLARRSAHGSPSLLWLDVPFAGTGAADFKAILRVKLATFANA